MMYGYNIRANIEGEGSCWIDYSAGSDVKEVEDVYSLIISIMNKRIDDLLIKSRENQYPKDVRELAFETFKDFPRQKRKPMCNDHETFMALNDLCGTEIIVVKLPNLAARRVRHVLTYNASIFQSMINMGGFDDLIESE